MKCYAADLLSALHKFLVEYIFLALNVKVVIAMQLKAYS